VAERAVKAGLVTGLRRFELVEMPEPVPRPGVAVAAIALCGICGTDVHGFGSADPYNPAICGHEWVGTVIAPGDGVTNVVEGDRVVPGSAPPCGQCPECRSGRPDYCARAFLGVIGRDAMAPPHGAFAPRLALDARRLVPVPPGLTDVQAAVVEPTTVALHAVRRTPPRAGGTVVVQGCGPIGLLTLQCARAEGAEHLIAVEPNAGRRALARALGADQALTPQEAAEALAGAPADLVYECAGAPPAIQAAVDLVGRGGRVNLVGVSGPASIQPKAWTVKEVSVTGSLAYLHEESAAAMELIAGGHVRVEPLHDATVPLAQAAAAFATLADDPGAAVKILVDPRS
jgi:(R,R)-butanediol dehydrogenase / meso-butanediol dehydrogenase / diacetyl reductase